MGGGGGMITCIGIHIYCGYGGCLGQGYKKVPTMRCTLISAVHGKFTCNARN